MRSVHFCLILTVATSISLSAIGIHWGLPSRSIDPFLFGEADPWPGEKIYRLAGAAEKLSESALRRRGADVDVDPLGGPSGEPVLLTGSDEDVAKILLRYRLYTSQPDEMITMMALAGMKPRKLQFDPRLYQYGGLFIYPVGAMIGAAGVLGLIDVRGDVVYYLDNPDEFGKFYVVARLYAAAWGAIGVLVVFAIARRLVAGGRVNPLPDGRGSDGDRTARGSGSDKTEVANWTGVLAAAFFTLMPVVVCMAHEGKPHLPGAVLMLIAVWFAMRHFDRVGALQLALSADPRRTLQSSRGLTLDASRKGQAPAAQVEGGESSANWWSMCIACGAAVGMVLSSWPICVLILLVALIEWSRDSRTIIRGLGGCLAGVAIAVAVYAITNPYVLINAFANRDILASNFGNSFAMYEIARIGEGLVRVVELTIEGATLPIVVLGLLVALVATLDWRRDPPIAWLLIVPAAVFFLQFVMIGAGKPGEYGRFGIFTNTALAIGAACLLTRPIRPVWARRARAGAIVIVILWTASGGWRYLHGFIRDSSVQNSRIELARQLADPTWRDAVVGLAAEPAPYSCPPLNFANREVFLTSDPASLSARLEREGVFIRTVDRVLVGAGLNRVMTTRSADRPSEGSPYFRFLRDRETPISWADKPFEIVPMGPAAKLD